MLSKLGQKERDRHKMISIMCDIKEHGKSKTDAQMKWNLRNSFQQKEDQSRENGQRSVRGHSDDSVGCGVCFKVFMSVTISITVCGPHCLQ